MPNLTDPGTALVTGASAGIGLEFAHQLGRRGHDLVLVARDAARLERTAEGLRGAYGVSVETLPADLADAALRSAVEARLADTDRPVDLLVNNAGFGLRGGFLGHDVAAEQAMIEVMVVAPMRLAHAALGAMTERGRGGVINVSSLAAFLPRGTYSSAKAWVNSFSAWAAREYAPRGVRVMALCPGFVRTEFHDRMGVGRGAAPAYFWLDPERVVREALADFDRGRALSIPTRRYRMVARVSRLLPQRALGGYARFGPR